MEVCGRQNCGNVARWRVKISLNGHSGFLPVRYCEFHHNFLSKEDIIYSSDWQKLLMPSDHGLAPIPRDMGMKAQFDFQPL